VLQNLDNLKKLQEQTVADLSIENPDRHEVLAAAQQILKSLLDQALSLGTEGLVKGDAVWAAANWVASFASTSTGASGESVLGRIQAKASELSSQLVTGYTRALTGLDQASDIFVTDYGRLEAAAKHARSDWAMDNVTQEATSRLLKLSARKWFTEALMPLGYFAWELNNEKFRSNDPLRGTQDCSKLELINSTFKYEEPANGQQFIMNQITKAPDPYPRVVWALVADTGRARSDRGVRRPVPGPRFGPLFMPVNPEREQNLGLYKPYFFLHNFHTDNWPYDCGD
jgi:hypothetical protein